MDYIFGELPTALKVVIAFFVVLGLIGGATYVIRRFGADHLGAAAARGRQPRLALIDQAPIDNRRRLILIRRDNVEHLLIIGGPTDVVVEQNIVRTATAGRETPATRSNAVADTLPRPVPLAEGTLWPLQPEPPPRPQQRAAPEEPVHWSIPQSISQPEPAPRTQRQAETLAGLADELSARPARGGAAAEPSRMPAAPAQPEALTPAADANLAEMAQRLEAALRRPIPQDQKNGSARPAAEQTPAKRAEPRTAEARSARGEPKQGKTLYDSLEQEMASLLGRPNKS